MPVAPFVFTTGSGITRENIMPKLYIHSDVNARLLYLDGPWGGTDFVVRDSDGITVDTSVFASRQQASGEWRHLMDASNLTPWSPDHPVLYTLEIPGVESLRFGFCELTVSGNREIAVNGRPCYFRGYIRGITAHDHPNLSEKSDYEAYCHHIRQAKKYGFNLVRFHSTVPDPEFVRAADELGMFIHMEIGFFYRYDSGGNKVGLDLDNQTWSDTIRRYRNHPSVAIFCLGNEMHNSGRRPEVRELYRLGKQLAPGKLIMDNSGWGEFDRSSADVFAQHIAYFFPFKSHRDMFVTDNCWRINGSVSATPLETSASAADGAAVTLRRFATPIRPVLAHEAVHYIELPDYDALNAKFDAFAARVGADELAARGIRKPRFMTELPELIRTKGLAGEYPELRHASERFKMTAIKTYLERLRLSGLCGFEMLQFADCFKYENKNGIVDCFDDDKYIPPAWMLNFNGPTALLADWPDESFYCGDTLQLPLWLSHFGTPVNATGDLTVTLIAGEHREVIARAERIVTTSGLQKLADLTLANLGPGTVRRELEAVFSSPEFTVTNRWEFRVFPRPGILIRPLDRLADRNFAAQLAELTAPDAPAKPRLVLRDRLDEAVFDDLAAGRTVLLFYHRDHAGQTGMFPGALERFKPCIWDRGSNLGGLITADWLREALGGDRYFDLHMYPLLEGGYKLNFDHIPVPGDRMTIGVDKPVRDRMKGMVQNIKHFIADDTLRKFTHLTAWRVGAGVLVVSTFSTARAAAPAAATAFAALINQLEKLAPQAEIAPEILRNHLLNSHPVPEDVMNRFWEQDNKIVEDTLFWEECGVDLAKIK